MVDFSMKHPIRMGKRWSALGIGDTMADMDIAIMFISSGRPKRIRDYFSKSYGPPEEDKQQDWILSRHRTKSIDEMIELGFSRKLETDDNEKDRSLDGCVLFQFAANAGHYGSNFAVRKHEEWPDLYKACDIKKHCIKKDETEASKESSENDKEEISESNDDNNNDNIDEADDVIVDEIISLKKRTEGKTKEENRRQLESTQIENEDGTSTTNLIIPLSGATFSTLIPSENVNEVATTASEGSAGSEEGVTPVSGETSLNVQEEEATTASSSVEASAEGGLQAINNNLATEASNPEATESPSSPETVAATENGVTPLLVEGGAAAANNEVEATTTAGSSEITTTATSDNIETTTPGANVTQQPVHIIPMIGGELNSTMYIPGSENDILRNAPEGGDGITPEGGDGITPESGEGIQGGNNETFGGAAATPTTLEPAFSIYSTVQERPTTIFSSGESINNSEDVTEASPSSEENTEANNGVTENASQNSETFEGSESIPAVTVSLNNFNATVSPILGSNEAAKTTTESERIFGKNQIETITVPTELKQNIADAGKALTNFADTLNNTVIEVVEGATIATSGSKVTTNSEGGLETNEEITTPGTIEIVVPEESTTSETNVGEITPGTETSLKFKNDENSFSTSEGNEEETTTEINEKVTESSGGGKKGNKGKGGGKGKNNKKGKGKNNSGNNNLEEVSTTTSTTDGENDATTVSSEVTTAASGIENIEETTIFNDDSDLTLTSEATTNAVTFEATSAIVNGIATNSAADFTSTSGALVSTTSIPKITKVSEGQTSTTTTTIDSDANGSTVAIGMLPEINSSNGIQTTVATGIIPGATTTVQLVTGGDSNEAGDTTENLLEILSTTVTKLGQGLRDSAVTDSLPSAASVTINTITSPSPTMITSTTQTPLNESPKPEENLSTLEVVEGSGEASSFSPTMSSSSSSPSDVPTTPIPGPFDHHKQQLINELGKDAVGNPKEGCGESHEDYSQCTVYFKNYLGRVQTWANENHERMEDQYGK
uniref:DOMON domain-containing protein n=1 Tax=Panagrolaimus superbus TaxID=310955 RepID=A0A914Z7Y2_9BILA